MKKILLILFYLPMLGFGQDNNVIYRKDLFQGNKYLLEEKFQSKQKYIQTHAVEDQHEEEQLMSDTTKTTRVKNRNRSSKKSSAFDPIMSLYPVILIHGLNGDWRSWDQLSDGLLNNGWEWGGYLDYCLNATAVVGSSNLQAVCNINADITKHTSGLVDGDFYVVDFDCNQNTCVGIVDNNVLSNQSAIILQGRVLGDAIDDVLQQTGKDKVILMGHSMGGLAAREYIENSSHWKYDPNAHRVAKLITTGTPHGGCDKTDAGIFSTIFNGIDLKSEAVRDLRTQYTGTPFGSGYPGAYLFGGPPMMENDNDIDNGGFTYNNVDINCDGDELDGVVGLNTAASIPGNLERTCIVGTSGGDDDDIVDTLSANINNYYNSSAEVFKINYDHLDLTDADYTNFKALDEPEYFKWAYKIDVGVAPDPYTGYLTFQAPNHPDLPWGTDFDSYYFLVNQYSLIDIYVDDLNTNGSVELFADDVNYTSQAFDNANSAGTAIIQKYLTPGKYYIGISADAYGNTIQGSYPWDKPYNFTVSTSGTSDISESSSQNRTLLKITDVLGRETKGTKNELLFYIYDDGSVVKRIIVE